VQLAAWPHGGAIKGTPHRTLRRARSKADASASSKSSSLTSFITRARSTKYSFVLLQRPLGWALNYAGWAASIAILVSHKERGLTLNGASGSFGGTAPYGGVRLVTILAWC
jgi:hypothetical protein